MIEQHDFSKIFDNKPEAQAHNTLILALSDPMNKTQDLQRMLQWCEEKRPDIFEDYEVTLSAEALPDKLEEPSDENFDEQLAWLKNNFSKKRYESLIHLRDQLRQSGTLSDGDVIPRESKATSTKFKSMERINANKKHPLILLLLGVLTIGGLIYYISKSRSKKISH